MSGTFMCGRSKYNATASDVPGGANGQSQQMVKESIWSKRQINFKQISLIEACMTFAYRITWTSSRWNDVWGEVRNL